MTMLSGTRPDRYLEAVAAAHARLLDELADVDDDTTRRPSLLPGWTVGHVLTHLARNADGLRGMFEAARRGEVADQYPGGAAQRNGDIERGAQRPGLDIVTDLAAACARLEDAFAATPEDVWANGIGRTAAGEVPLPEIVFRRRREVEVHLVDLGLGYTADDWPEGFVDDELARAVADLPDRLAPELTVEISATDGPTWAVPSGRPPTATITADRRRLLAWLLGRRDEPDFPTIGPWQR